MYQSLLLKKGKKMKNYVKIGSLGVCEMVDLRLFYRNEEGVVWETQVGQQ